MKLYHELAELWPLLSPPEDYEAEAAAMHALIQQHVGGRAGLSVLELGAGGGHSLYHLKQWYDCTAVDLSPEMLTQCRQLNPEVKTVRGDMRDVRLNRTFDAVLVHDAIDYMTTPEDVMKTLVTVREHLTPGGTSGGGVAFLAPTYLAETFENHAIEADVCGDLATGRVLAYSSYVHQPDPQTPVIEMVLTYMINDDGVVRVIDDRHRCGLFSEADWRQWLRDAGFDAERVELDTDNADDAPPFEMFIARLV